MINIEKKLMNTGVNIAKTKTKKKIFIEKKLNNKNDNDNDNDDDSDDKFFPDAFHLFIVCYYY